MTMENGYQRRVASTTTVTQTTSDFYAEHELEQTPSQIQTHAPHRRSLHDSQKSMSRDRTPSPPPTFSSSAYTRAGAEAPSELSRQPAPMRRRTLPEPVLHPFVRHSPSQTFLACFFLTLSSLMIGYDVYFADWWVIPNRDDETDRS